MDLTTFQFKTSSGWTIKKFPDLDSESTLILLFAAPEFANDPKPFAEISNHYPRAKIIGCSSAGEIAGTTILDKSISVSISRFDHTTIKIASAEINKTDESYAAGEKIAKSLLSEDLKGIFILSTGLNVNGSELVRGINSVCHKNILVTGGLAGDGDRFKKTWTFFDGEMHENAAVAVGFYGNKIAIGHGSQGGWDVFGPERRITRAKDNILYELDNKPALAIYKEYLGERASGLPATGLLFPLAIRKDKNDPTQLVRTILGVDEASQSLIFAGDTPEGYLAKLMRANFDRLINGANEAAQFANSKLPDKGASAQPTLAIAISCVGRRLLLGSRTEEEVEATLSSLPINTQQVGFYSYGELSPYASGKCDFHNQTMTLTTLQEGL